MVTSVVIPVGGGREENLRRCVASISAGTVKPDEIVIAYDGCFPVPLETPILTRAVVLTKHEPGLEQPRNEGVWASSPDADYVWFVDSDLVFVEDALERLLERATPGGVTFAPYDWLPDGVTEPMPELFNDPRWPMFNEPRWEDPNYVSVEQLNVGLGCFSGNLLWDVHEFERLGGFWNDIHHARCEDGELGLRAVAHSVPIRACKGARGFHVEHPRNTTLAMQWNERDVPMINARHPWVEGEGLFVVERDGRRFDQLCPACGTAVNSILYWQHRADCTS